MGLGSNIASAGLGLATAGWQDRRQLEQQEKLQALQIEGSKEMGAYNQGLALDTWEKTNYDAQRKQMEKAGLNVGMMYGGTGAGGTTQGGGGGNVSGATATGGSGEIGMAMQMGLQQEMQKAQIKVAESQAEKNTVEAEKIGGVDTEESKARTTNLEANTNNQKVNNEILGFQKEMDEIKTNSFKDFEQDYRGSIQNAYNKLYAEAQSAIAKGTLDEATWREKEQQIKNETISSGIQIEAQRKGLIKQDADIAKVNQEIKNMTMELEMKHQEKFINWTKLELSERETIVKELMMQNQSKMTEFNTSTPQQIKQWTSIFTDAIGAVKGMGGSKGSTYTEHGDGWSSTEYTKN